MPKVVQASLIGFALLCVFAAIHTPTISADHLPEIIDIAIDDNIRGDDTYVGLRDEVQIFTGVFSDDNKEVLVVFPNLVAGDTIYIYAAGLGFVDPYVEVMDESVMRLFAKDDDSGGGYNSALSYTVRTDATYTVRVTTIGQSGNYQITAGVNTPQILDLIHTPPTLTVPAGGFDCASIEQSGTRQNLTALNQSRAGEAYIIHYTLTGDDATTEAYVDAMQEAIERSLDIQFNELGWAVPPADCGEGGDSRLDIYVVDLVNAPGIGIAIPEGVVGDNPATERQEFFATYSYLLVDNDMDFLGTGAGLALMSATVAHEIHHNIQFGYDFNDSYHGFYEAGATWIEALVYPATNTIYDYVADVFETPDVCIGRINNSDLREYGEWLMIDSFTRDLGIASYQYIWEFIGTHQGLSGFYAALNALDTTPQEVIKHMALRNLLLDYALAKRFTSTVFIENTITGTGFVSPQRNGVQQLGVDYLSIRADRRLTFDVSDADAALTMLVVGVNTDDETAQVFDIGRRGTVDTSNFDYAYLLILNTRQHASPDDCEYTNWTVRVTDGTNSPLTPADTKIWNASQFIPPSRIQKGG